MAAPIEFFFDFASPYGYVASHLIEAVAGRHGRAVVWKPYMMGAVFKIAGTGPLMDYPLKGAYAARDMARTCRLHGLPLTFPDGFPHSTLAPARAFYWLADRDEGLATRFALAAYDAYFGAGRNTGDPAVTGEIAAGLGLDAGEVLAAIQDPAIKVRLKAETDSAIERGIFGSPFFIVDGEPFWGSDRLDQLEHWLASGGW
jgi:2-hydroxychromene-2-carboxylate isomerase